MASQNTPFVLDLPGECRIRAAENADAPAIASVYDDAYPAATDYPLVSEQAVQELLLDAEKTRPFVVEEENEVLAVAAIEYDSLDEGNAQICKLAVSRDHRGRGLGRALLKHRLNVLETDESFDGLAYSGAITSHPASQRNLVKQGFAPFSFHKHLQGEYFGPWPESEIIMLYTESVEYAERTVYVPHRYRDVVEQTLSQISLDLLGRDLEITEGAPYPGVDSDWLATDLEHEREFLWEVTAAGDDVWAETEQEILTAARNEDVHLMVPLDANARELWPLYGALEGDGFQPAGFIPDWLTRDGEKRDAFVFQYPPSHDPTKIAVIDEVKSLLDVLGLDYRVRESRADYWTLEI